MEDTPEAPTGMSLIEKIVHIQGIAAEPYRTPITGTPKEIADKFHWADHLTKPESYLPQLKKFFDHHTDFPISQDEIATCWQTAFAQAKEIYEIMFPEGTQNMQYHNLIHAKITAVTANKMLLGALVTQPEYQNINPGLLHSLIKLAAIAAVFHEINDWWHLGPNPHLAEAKALLEKYLTEQGLSTTDFNRLIALDSYAHEVEEVVNTVIEPTNMNENDKFLADNHIPSVLDNLNMETKKSLLTLIGNIFVSSDFCQIANPAYHQPAKVWVDGQEYDSNVSSIALAIEASNMRPQSLPRMGFGTADGKISWSSVKFTWEFLQFALSKIKDGFPHLRAFDQEEYQRAYETLGAISGDFHLADYFHQNFPQAANP